MKLLYISGKYSAPSYDEIEQNIKHAEVYARKYIKMGYAVHCPHKNTAHFEGLVPYYNFIKADIKIMSRCDGIVMIPGWKESKGAKIEFLFATLLGLDVIFDDI